MKRNKIKVTITRSRVVEVYADTKEEAIQHVTDMYISGDSSAELNDAVYTVPSIAVLNNCYTKDSRLRVDVTVDGITRCRELTFYPIENRMNKPVTVDKFLEIVRSCITKQLGKI